MMKKYQIGLVPYLNACPLGHGLDEKGLVQVRRVPPSRLAQMLENDSLDVALVPVVDYLAHPSRWEISVPYGICSRGEVWTVKIFSPVPVEKIDTLFVDTDSHTSINLARVLTHRIAGKIPELVAKDFSGVLPTTISEPTLLIGDKTWRVKHAPFIYDLGKLWGEQFNLPFVYAVWASKTHELADEIKEVLSQTAELNLNRLNELGKLYGPGHGFSAEEACEYFQRIIHYRLGPEEQAGMMCFKECLEALSSEIPCRG